jgi:hypothetical protein
MQRKRDLQKGGCELFVFGGMGGWKMKKSPRCLICGGVLEYRDGIRVCNVAVVHGRYMCEFCVEQRKEDTPAEVSAEVADILTMLDWKYHGDHDVDPELTVVPQEEKDYWAKSRT